MTDLPEPQNAADSAADASPHHAQGTIAGRSHAGAWVAHRWIEPPRSRNRILLATAISQLCGGEWGVSGDEVSAAGMAPETDPALADRMRSACNLIGRLLFEGRVQSWARPIGGGDPVELPASAWELDDFAHRMSTSAIDPTRPFEVEAEPTHWIFLSEPDWEEALARLWGHPQSVETAREARNSRVRVEVALATSEPQSETLDEHAAPDGRLLRLPEVLHRTGLSRATLYRRIAANEFPEGLSLGGNVTAWAETEVEAWIGSRQRMSTRSCGPGSSPTVSAASRDS